MLFRSSSSVITASVSAINSPVSSSKISSLTNEPSNSCFNTFNNSSGSFAYFLYNDFKFNSLVAKKCSIISLLSLKKSTAFKNTVAKTFFFLSIFTLKKSFLSVSNSNQVPLYGIIFPENKSLPI